MEKLEKGQDKTLIFKNWLKTYPNFLALIPFLPKLPIPNRFWKKQRGGAPKRNSNYFYLQSSSGIPLGPVGLQFTNATRNIKKIEYILETIVFL